MPGGYDISGSAAWFAKADTGLTVGRAGAPGYAVVSSWKARHKRLGKIGFAKLTYDIDTGRFGDHVETEIVVNTDEEDEPWHQKI